MRERDSVLCLSKQAIDFINDIKHSGYRIIHGISIFESPIFPFEICYDACDISTKEPVKIASGEWVHGVVVPSLPDFNESEPLKFQFAPEITEEDRRNAFLDSFMLKRKNVLI